MRCKIYITDEGLGPIVRQSAIIDELKKIDSRLDFDLQTQRHYDDAMRIIKNVKHLKKFNNIIWSKNPDGSPDTNSIRDFFKDYNKLSNNYITEELQSVKYDFLISDFVYETFEIADKTKIPSFGVAHFTWDWFFSKLYPPPHRNNCSGTFFSFCIKGKSHLFSSVHSCRNSFLL